VTLTWYNAQMNSGFPELLAALRAGGDTREAQEEIYLLVSARLLEPLRGRVRSCARSRLDAEDVLHEAFLRALENLPGTNHGTEREFLAWVYRIARNLMIDQARRMSAGAMPFARSTVNASGSSLPRESRIPGRERNVESRLERREVIESVLNQMRDSEAEVIRRRWLAGQSYAEMASALRRTPKAVKGLYTRALKRFTTMARRLDA
jgi:RNA polymerase sigma-70 factor (ECF subfamily)